MEGYLAYLQGLHQTPNEKYRDDMQAFVNMAFDNNTRLQYIYEEGLDFNHIFNNECEVIMDSVSETYTNVTKILGNYKSIKYKDCNHETVRGQYILYDDSYYLVYEGSSKLRTTSHSKIIMCNNKIKWHDNETQEILEYPVFIGLDLSSTNKQVDKDGLTSNGKLILMIQGNENTESIKVNQRFVLSNRQAFKVNAIDYYSMSDYETNKTNMIKMYIEYTPINEFDNLEENISNSVDNYEINISTKNITNKQNSSGLIYGTVTKNEFSSEVPILYKSLDDKIVTVNENGEYILVGEDGDKTSIICYVSGHSDVYSEIYVSISNSSTTDDKIVIEPLINGLMKYDSVTFKAYLVSDGNISNDVVSYTVNDIDKQCYTLAETINKNEFILSCQESNSEPLVITFESGLITNKATIELMPFF